MEEEVLGEGKGFVEEMRFVAMNLHTREQATEVDVQPWGGGGVLDVFG